MGRFGLENTGTEKSHLPSLIQQAVVSRGLDPTCVGREGNPITVRSIFPAVERAGQPQQYSPFSYRISFLDPKLCICNGMAEPGVDTHMTSLPFRVMHSRDGLCSMRMEVIPRNTKKTWTTLT
jgi:hypothetical protein